MSANKNESTFFCHFLVVPYVFKFCRIAAFDWWVERRGKRPIISMVIPLQPIVHSQCINVFLTFISYIPPNVIICWVRIEVYIVLRHPKFVIRQLDAHSTPAFPLIVDPEHTPEIIPITLVIFFTTQREEYIISV